MYLDYITIKIKNDIKRREKKGKVLNIKIVYSFGTKNCQQNKTQAKKKKNSSFSLNNEKKGEEENQMCFH